MFGHGKLLKSQLSRIIPRIENQPIIAVLLNQVYTSADSYGNVKLTSGGGWGIKHYAQLRLEFRGGKDEVEDLFVTNRYSELNIVKSKLSPLFKGLNMVIDITKGGAIDPVKSMMEFAKKLGIFYTSGRWWKIDENLFDQFPQFDFKFPCIDSDNKSRNWGDFARAAQERPKLIKLLQLYFIKKISNTYSYQAEICKPYYDQLMKEMESPEYLTREDGSIVDLWTGEIVKATTEEAADLLNEVLDLDNLDAVTNTTNIEEENDHQSTTEEK